jgi:uncharacterized protein YndB with AHSA1/START domain
MTTDRAESRPTRSASHATFVIERVFSAAPARVFAAFAEPEAKAKWFVGPPGRWKVLAREHEFRVGGRERLVGAFDGGAVSAFDCRYQDIVDGERIIYTYEMQVNERRISVSLATVELRPEGSGTRMVYTEQGVFLDGYDDCGERERGTQALFDQLDRSLRGEPVG